MAELDEYQEIISTNLTNLEDFINRSALFNNDQVKWKVQVGKDKGQIRKYIILLEEGLKDENQSQARSYIGSVKSFKVRLQKLDTDVEKRIRGESFIGFQKDTIIKTAEQKRQNAQKQIFDKGDKYQEMTLMNVKEMNQMTQKGISMVNEINVELTAQIQQLDRMNQKTQDTRSTLKRAQKNIVYFMKALECDKCMVGLLALILLALVAVIVLAIKKGQGQ